ncbi:Uncharacterised protein [Klebsiella variicola]|uniref:Uncharacterized protein n=1 Tax=Klebsiella variicola TaxID=244366 RepID=A0A7H4MJ05_KLEVA|nr:Uncharacterised protein [Klebsiella variicola]
MSMYSLNWMFLVRRMLPQRQRLFSRSVRLVICVRSMLVVYSKL